MGLMKNYNRVEKESFERLLRIQTEKLERNVKGRQREERDGQEFNKSAGSISQNPEGHPIFGLKHPSG